jgi:hypothetical protein
VETYSLIKIPVIVRPDYVFYIEDVTGHSFMHCDVFKWNKTVFKELKKDWNTFTDLHGGPLYACKERDTAGYMKFIKALGFKFLQPIKGVNGNEVNIYYWSN